MKRDRFLIGIIIGIGVLAVASLLLFFIRRQSANYVTGTAPEDVVQNYALAVQKQDYHRAYGYLAEGENKPSYPLFLQAFNYPQINSSGVSLEVGDAVVEDNRATVTVTVVRASGGLFSGINRDTTAAVLVKQSGTWKISSLPYPFWSYDWYQSTPKQAPPLPTP